MRMNELSLEQDDMEEYMRYEEMACCAAVEEVAAFIRAGAITFEEVEKVLRGGDNDS